MEIVGPVPIKVNGRYAITVTNFNVKKAQNTKQHAGAFGVFGTIAIQGHTDERGSAPHNWELSAKRATAVLDYLFESNKALAEQYGSYFAASAYSKFRPINTAQNEAAYRQNRRIELAVVP